MMWNSTELFPLYSVCLHFFSAEIPIQTFYISNLIPGIHFTTWKSWNCCSRNRKEELLLHVQSTDINIANKFISVRMLRIYDFFFPFLDADSKHTSWKFVGGQGIAEGHDLFEEVRFINVNSGGRGVLEEVKDCRWCGSEMFTKSQSHVRIGDIVFRYFHFACCSSWSRINEP